METRKKARKVESRKGSMKKENEELKKKKERHIKGEEEWREWSK